MEIQPGISLGLPTVSECKETPKASRSSLFLRLSGLKTLAGRI